MGKCFICGRDTDQPGSFHFSATQEDILHYCDKHANNGRKLFAMIHKGEIDKDKLKKAIDKRQKLFGEEKEKPMNENYIMLNGKRVDLTEDQLEKLGIKVEKDYFQKSNCMGSYCCINAIGELSWSLDYGKEIDNKLYKVANYCTDKSLMQQRALHETLSRLLWRFSMQNDGDKIDWYPQSDHCVDKYRIFYDNKLQQFDIATNDVSKTQGTVYFHTIKIAKRAIEEVILPFMKEHPDFVW